VSDMQRQEEQGPSIRCLSVEPDGVMARLRRGRVPMETPEQEREGDVSREVKGGAACVGEPEPCSAVVRSPNSLSERTEEQSLTHTVLPVSNVVQNQRKAAV